MNRNKLTRSAFRPASHLTLKHVARTLILGATSLAVTIGISTTAIAGTIKVGVNAALSGPTSSHGALYAKGVEAGLAYISEANGHKIEMIMLDDASDPTTAGRNARKLIDEHNVDILLATGGVPAAIALAQVGREAKVPVISLPPAPLDPKDNPWVVAIAQPTPLMINAVLERMQKDGIKSVGYIGFSDAWGDLVYDALIKGAPEYGIKVLGNERYARSDSSVTGQVLKLMSMRPDAIMTGGAGTPGALPFLTLAERGYKGPVYGQHALINPDFVRVAGSAAEGALMSTGPVIVAEQLPDDYITKKITLDFRDTYQKVTGTQSSDAYSAYSFDGWLLIADAAARAKGEPGTPEFRESLREAITTTKELVGTHGVYTFTPGNLYGVDDRARVMVTLENGQWKLVK